MLMTAPPQTALKIRPGEDADLDALLARVAGYSCEFPVVLANHLPMVLVALTALGATPRRRAAFAERYIAANRLLPMPPDHARIDASNWTAYLGNRQLEGDYRGFFSGEVARLGPDGAVAAYLPTLLPGIAASALHAFMRLAYARLRGDAAEVATALGYWAAMYLPLGDGVGAEPDTDDPAEVFRRLAREPAYAEVTAPTDLLWHWLRAGAAVPEFAPVVDWLRVGPDTLRRIAVTALALFAAMAGKEPAAAEFGALHAVTGAHWVRLLDHDGVVGAELPRRFWQAIAAAFAYMGCPGLPSLEQVQALRTRPAPPWPEIHAAACAADDEHDISLVFSAWQEETMYGDPLYRVVAARRVRLLP
jgi:hypothetical protein